MGYYGGYGGRLIAKSPTLSGVSQPAPTVDPTLGTVSCNWKPTWHADLKGWPPGCYLLKLDCDQGQQYIPFVVRDDTSTAAYMVMTSATTYQAYNDWGGYSLYHDEEGSRAKRAKVVSFNRPFSDSYGAGGADFMGNEFPLVYDMERQGLDCAYWTDIDLHLRGEQLVNHRALMSLGHDEYWSREMRDHATTALNQGTNLAFLGANAIYRKIRLDPQYGAPARLEINYKDDTDPAGKANPADGTSNWASPPVNEPESTLTGVTYVIDSGLGDLVVCDPSGWWWKGTGVTEGEHFRNVWKGEYNRFVPTDPGPKNVQIFGHSPMNRGAFADITYWTKSDGGGVFSVGIGNFISLLSDPDKIPTNIFLPAVPQVTAVLQRAMVNLYGLIGKGAASKSMPSEANWQQYYH